MPEFDEFLHFNGREGAVLLAVTGDVPLDAVCHFRHSKIRSRIHRVSLTFCLMAVPFRCASIARFLQRLPAIRMWVPETTIASEIERL